jgi:hypothetical protein
MAVKLCRIHVMLRADMIYSCAGGYYASGEINEFSQ